MLDELRPGRKNVIVEKRFYSAFTQTDLGAVLRSNDVGRLALVGQHTDCGLHHAVYDSFVVGTSWSSAPPPRHSNRDPEEAVALWQGRALDYLRTYYGARLHASHALGR